MRPLKKAREQVAEKNKEYRTSVKARKEAIRAARKAIFEELGDLDRLPVGAINNVAVAYTLDDLLSSDFGQHYRGTKEQILVELIKSILNFQNNKFAVSVSLNILLTIYPLLNTSLKKMAPLKISYLTIEYLKRLMHIVEGTMHT